MEILVSAAAPAGSGVSLIPLNRQHTVNQLIQSLFPHIQDSVNPFIDYSTPTPLLQEDRKSRTTHPFPIPAYPRDHSISIPYPQQVWDPSQVGSRSIPPRPQPHYLTRTEKVDDGLVSVSRFYTLLGPFPGKDNQISKSSISSSNQPTVNELRTQDLLGSNRRLTGSSWNPGLRIRPDLILAGWTVIL